MLKVKKESKLMFEIGLGHYLTLGAIIFTIGVVGIFNRDLSASEITALHNAYATIYSL